MSAPANGQRATNRGAIVPEALVDQQKLPSSEMPSVSPRKIWCCADHL
jgi:hypothetical protein